jgi:hypothetical protein
MSKFNTIRTGLLGSAAIVSLLAVAPAQAVEAQFGEVSITFDTTVSMGASMLTQEREKAFLPETNGGPVDPRDNLALGARVLGNGLNAAPVPFSGIAGAGNNVTYTNNPNNFDGSLNADDGRLNFNRGDLIGANVKATHDLIVGYQNYKIFARATGFYDVIMNDKDVGDHAQLTDQALGDVGRNYDLLDLFVSADYTLGDLPLNIRVGKQVINWGESTFIQNGLNVFNPIDVAAIRKPGSEIKEALVPVNSVFASVSFPFQVGLSGWYALDWEPFEIDPSGTPFSGADVIASGSGLGGNQSYSFVTGGPFSGARRNCDAIATTGTYVVQNGIGPNAALLPVTYVGAATGNNRLDCSDSPFVNYSTPFPVGQHELIRLGQLNGTGGQANLSADGYTSGNIGALRRGEDHQANDGGQFGVKASWFAEDLNGTEFGLYYQNYHSRLPIVSINALPDRNGGADIGYFQNGTSFNITNTSSSLQSRQLNNAGCGLTSPTLIGTIGLTGVDVSPAPGFQASAADTINGTLNAVLGLPTAGGTAAFQMANTPVIDPSNILVNAASNGLLGAMGLYNHPTLGYKNQYNVAKMNCALTYYQSGLVVPIDPVSGLPVAAAATVQSYDGAEFLLASMDAGVEIDYAEDIEVFGFSFNTTVGGWGVQAEATYRPSAPFQVDTDSLTVAGLIAGCTFHQLYGAAGAALAAAATPDGSGVKPVCGAQDGTQSGVIRNEMFTAQIGTTSQMTGSSWFVQILGADIATLVTEVGMVYTPSVEDTWISNGGANMAQYQNIGCQGTDLPLAGALSLDAKTSDQCRPTDLSAGLVMLFTWSYNNFLDTGFAVAPRLVYSYDFEGTTAAPYSNYSEDRQAINLGVDGTLNNNLRLGVSYSNFFGGHINNKSRDRDFASVSASYSF